MVENLDITIDDYFQKVEELKNNGFEMMVDLTAVDFEVTGLHITYKTGLAIAIPEGFVGLLFPRSSVYKTGQYLTNSVGVIDGGYRDTIKVRFRYILQPEDLVLDGKEEKVILTKVNLDKIYKKGDKIAQLVWMNQNKLFIEFSQSVPLSERGAGGFGSTGF